MNEERKEPETAQEVADMVWADSVSRFGRIFNTRAFWIPGLISGFAGIGLSLAFVPAETPVRLLVGMVSFLVLWLGVGMTASALSRRGG